MIKTLTIENFQSHKLTELDFDPGVNIIVGSTDSGKTAIIRALRWLVWNRPSGEAFRSHWGGDTKVEGNFNGIDISRTKGKDNFYHCDGVVFTAFGTEVPFEVRHHLQIDEINLQQQLDRPFLLTDSPGEVARYFNEVANLDKIDTGVKNVQREIRQIEQDIRSTEATLEESQQEIQKYEYLDKMEAEVEVLEEMEGQVVGQRMQINRLNELIGEITTVESNIESFQTKVKMDKEITNILNLIEERKALIHNITTLDNLIEEAIEIEQLIENTKKITGTAKAVDGLLKLTSDKYDLVQEVRKLSTLIKKTATKTRALASWKKEVKTLEEIFHNEMPDTCPLCNQKIKK